MLSYKDSGVDIDEGNALVDGLKPLVQSTFDANVIGGIGSFAGAYAMPSGYRQPVILGAHLYTFPKICYTERVHK